MSKPSQSSLGRTARLLDLVPYLASHQGIALSHLAQDFSVTEPEMIADLTTLWMCGLPGYTPLELMDLSFESGFVTIRNASTLSNPRRLSEEEMIALLLGLDLVIESLPSEREDLRVIAADLVARLSSRVSVPTKLSAKPSTPGSVRAVIQDLLQKRGALEILYHSSYSDTVTSRVVTPIEFREENNFEYLWAFCQRAGGFRSFRLDRIQSAQLSQMPTYEPESPVQDKAATISYTLRAHSRPRQIMERFGIDKSDFAGDLPAASFSYEWIRRSILACSGSVELVQPASVRALILHSGRAILERYKAG